VDPSIGRLLGRTVADEAGADGFATGVVDAIGSGGTGHELSLR
jgi:hypothetical protein